MKWLGRAGAAVLLAPLALILLWGAWEGFGMWANHAAARRQADALRMRLEAEVPDLAILDVRWEAGNLSGAGNHVECRSSIIFSTGLGEAELQRRLPDCQLAWTEEGDAVISLTASAPFPDNLEGH